MITYKNVSFCTHIFNTAARLAHKIVDFRVTKSELTIKIVTFFTLNLPCQNKSTLIRKFYDFLTANKSVLTIYFGKWNSFEQLVKSVTYGETFWYYYSIVQGSAPRRDRDPGPVWIPGSGLGCPMPIPVLYITYNKIIKFQEKDNFMHVFWIISRKLSWTPENLNLNISKTINCPVV